MERYRQGDARLGGISDINIKGGEDGVGTAVGNGFCDIRPDAPLGNLSVVVFWKSVLF